MTCFISSILQLDLRCLIWTWNLSEVEIEICDVHLRACPPVFVQVVTYLLPPRPPHDGQQQHISLKGSGRVSKGPCLALTSAPWGNRPGEPKELGK